MPITQTAIKADIADLDVEIRSYQRMVQKLESDRAHLTSQLQEKTSTEESDRTFSVIIVWSDCSSMFSQKENYLSALNHANHLCSDSMKVRHGCTAVRIFLGNERVILREFTRDGLAAEFMNVTRGTV